MKEFEKWCNEQIPESFDTKEIGIEERGMKKGWKGALKWIKYAGALEPSLANDLIDEELKE